MATQSSSTPKIYITGVADPLTGVTFPNKGVFPAAVALETTDASPVAVTGTTVAADKRWITLSATNWLAGNMRVGMWLYSAADNVLTQITAVGSYQNSIQVAVPFSTDFSATAIVLAKAYTYKSVKAISSGTANAKLQGVNFPFGKELLFEGTQGVAPVSYDASGANQQITFVAQ